MNVETQKLELIEWITRLKDEQVLEKMLRLKKEKQQMNISARSFGSGKHIFTYVAEDFNEPLDDFKEYMNP